MMSGEAVDKHFAQLTALYAKTTQWFVCTHCNHLRRGMGHDCPLNKRGDERGIFCDNCTKRCETCRRRYARYKTRQGTLDFQYEHRYSTECWDNGDEDSQ